MSTDYGFGGILCMCVCCHSIPVFSLEELLQITIATFRCSVMFTSRVKVLPLSTVKHDSTHFHERKTWPFGSHLTSSNPLSKQCQC